GDGAGCPRHHLHGDGLAGGGRRRRAAGGPVRRGRDPHGDAAAAPRRRPPRRPACPRPTAGRRVYLGARRRHRPGGPEAGGRHQRAGDATGMSQLTMALERRGIWQLAGVFRNAVQLGGAKLFARGLTLFWTVMLARVLGVVEFGEYTYLTALV